MKEKRGGDVKRGGYGRVRAALGGSEHEARSPGHGLGCLRPAETRRHPLTPDGRRLGRNELMLWMSNGEDWTGGLANYSLGNAAHWWGPWERHAQCGRRGASTVCPHHDEIDRLVFCVLKDLVDWMAHLCHKSHIEFLPLLLREQILHLLVCPLLPVLDPLWG